VLNAFRHHGIGHVAGLDKAETHQKCSTPSGIMESVTARSSCGIRSRGPVLNAFRHHGIGHQEGFQLRERMAEVLNAFRHHGIGHVVAAAQHRRVDRCSTPSGIMESVTMVGA